MPIDVMQLYAPWITLYFFVTGACIGSFLNVCIFRIPSNKSIIRPGSFCPHCKTPIPFYFNIPLFSYLLLKGRCCHCKATISSRYPLVEFITAVLCAVVFSRFGVTLSGVGWFVFCCTLVVISFIDLDHQIIPDRISLPGIPFFGFFAYFTSNASLTQIVSGVLLGGGILYITAFAYYKLKGIQGMGGGDIKLLAMIGAATGPKGVIFTLFTGSLLGTLAGFGTMYLSKNFNRRLRIPFGPYLSAAAILYVLYGQPIIQWYVNVIS